MIITVSAFELQLSRTSNTKPSKSEAVHTTPVPVIAALSTRTEKAPKKKKKVGLKIASSPPLTYRVQPPGSLAPLGYPSESRVRSQSARKGISLSSACLSHTLPLSSTSRTSDDSGYTSSLWGPIYLANQTNSESNGGQGK